MKAIIICEGHDDLWFLCYYFHKKMAFDIVKEDIMGNYIIPQTGGRNVQYMCSPSANCSLAIASANGQDGIKGVVGDVLKINQRFPLDNISKIVIFRDCDDRKQEEVAFEMNGYFENSIYLYNRKITKFNSIIDGVEVKVEILPIIIPFDENGAIETLLMKSISDRGKAGKYIVEHANSYIDEAVTNVKPEYLRKQRERTKAKYSAALAITDPTRSRSEFEKLMMETDWENSPSIDLHMAEIREFLK